MLICYTKGVILLKCWVLKKQLLEQMAIQTKKGNLCFWLYKYVHIHTKNNLSKST